MIVAALGLTMADLFDDRSVARRRATERRCPPHGQTGAAGNGIELHPVTAVTFH